MTFTFLTDSTSAFFHRALFIVTQISQIYTDNAMRPELFPHAFQTIDVYYVRSEQSVFICEICVTLSQELCARFAV